MATMSCTPRPAALRVTRETVGTVTELTLAGELDLATSQLLANELAHAVDSKSELIVLDMAGIEFLDATAMAVLVETHRKLEPAGRRLVIVDPSAVVRHAFEVAQLADLLSFARSSG